MKVRSFRSREQAVSGRGEDGTHGRIVGDDGKDDVGRVGDVGELLRRGAFQLGGQLRGGGATDVMTAR